MIRNRMICSQIFNISGRRLNLPTPPFFYLRTLGPIFPTRDIEDQTSYSVPKSSYQMTTCYLHYFPRKSQIGYSISKSSNKKFRTPLKAFVLSFPLVFFWPDHPKIPFGKNRQHFFYTLLYRSLGIGVLNLSSKCNRFRDKKSEVSEVPDPINPDSD